MADTDTHEIRTQAPERTSLVQVFAQGLTEIAAGLKRRPVWMALASEAILDQHRKTTLGPLWMVLNYLLYVGTFVVVLGDRGGVSNFPQYAATGMFVWLLISEAIRAGVILFGQEESYIKGTRLPLTVYVLRLTMQLLIRSGYAAIGWVLILVLTGFPGIPSILLAAVGCVLVVLTIPPMILVFAIVGVYFPDMRFVVQNLVRAGIFLTPVFWVADTSHGLRRLLYAYDPFTYLLGVVREPILYGAILSHTLWVSLGILASVWVLAVGLLGLSHKKIVFLL